MVRIVLVDDHTVVREAVAMALSLEPEFEIVGQADSPSEARRLMHEFDVAIVDLGFPEGNGVDLVAEMVEANPNGTVLVLSASLDRSRFARAVEAGAATVLHKSVTLDEIVDAVKRVRDGEALLSTREVVELMRLASHERDRDRRVGEAAVRLTAREREVLQALADGLNDAQIAKRLNITIDTERSHMKGILAKTSADSRLQAVLFAAREGMVDLR